MLLTDSDLKKKLVTSVVVTLISGFALFALTALGAVSDIDRKFTSEVHAIAVRHAPIEQIAKTVTFVGNPLVLTLLVGVVATILLVQKRQRVAIWLIGTTALGAIVETALKLAIRRSRPDLETVFLEARGTSFPSGHAMNTLVVLLAIVVASTATDSLNRRVLMSLAVAVSFSVAATRVLLGVHYISDVTAGFLLGMLWLSLMTPTRIRPAGC